MNTRTPLAILGGTGREGRGLSVRWARAGYDVVIGSRDPEKAAEKAREWSAAAGVSLRGTSNREAAGAAELVVLSVPYSAHAPTLEGVKDVLQGRILVDITVPLQWPHLREVHLPEGQAAALEAQARLGPGVRVVATLHHVSSARLGRIDEPVDGDVLVCGDDEEARGRVVRLVSDLGFRGLHAGPLRNAVALESLTPVLMAVHHHHQGQLPGIKVLGLPE